MDLRERTYNKCIKENIEDIKSKINDFLGSYNIPGNIKKKIIIETNNILKCMDNIFTMYLDLSLAKGEKKEKLENQLYDILMKKLRVAILTRYIQPLSSIWLESIFDVVLFYYPDYAEYYLRELYESYPDLFIGADIENPIDIMDLLRPGYYEIKYVICNPQDILVRDLINLYNDGLITDNKLIWIDKAMYLSHQGGSYIAHMCGAILPGGGLTIIDIPLRPDFFDFVMKCNEIIVKESIKILDCLRNYR